MMAEIQGEIMSFTSVLGLMMVSMGTNELMVFTPCLLIMMLKVLRLKVPGLY